MGFSAGRWHGTADLSEDALLAVSPSGQPWSYEVRDAWGRVVGGGGAAAPHLTVGGLPRGSHLATSLEGQTSSQITVTDFTDPRFPTRPGSVEAPLLSAMPRLRGVMGVGAPRMGAGAADPFASAAAVAQLAGEAIDWWVDYADTAHPRPLLALIGDDPAELYDRLQFAGGGEPDALEVYPADPRADGDTIFVGVAVTGGVATVTVATGTVNNVVETFAPANTATAVEVALQGSAHVRGYGRPALGHLALDPQARAPIGHAKYEAVRGLAVALAAAGVTVFELPYNEPQGFAQRTRPESIGHAYAQCAAAVLDGVPTARCVGPGTVDINSNTLGLPGEDVTLSWTGSFFRRVREIETTYTLQLLFGLSFHVYNSLSQDHRLLRQCLTRLKLAATSAGVPSEVAGELYMTEQGAIAAWWGSYRPLQTIRHWMNTLAVLEQEGCPFEHVNVWHDVDDDPPNGQWVTTFADGTLTPAVPAMRQLVAARYDRPFMGAVDFGDVGDEHFVGNRYGTDGGPQTLWVIAPGDGGETGVRLTVAGTGTATADGVTATLTAGAGTLLALDYAGNPQLVDVAAGAGVLPVLDGGVYLEVPAGVDVDVVPLELGASLLAGAAVTPSTAGQGGVPASRIVDDSAVHNPMIGNYTGPFPFRSASTALPQTYVFARGSATLARAVRVTTGPIEHFAVSTLLAFTVDVSADGTTWDRIGDYDVDPVDHYLLREVTGGSWAEGDVPGATRRVRWVSYYGGRFRWVFPFSQRSVRSVRVTVTRVAPPNALDATTLALQQGQSGDPGSTYVTLDQVQLYDGDTSPFVLLGAAAAPTGASDVRPLVVG